MSLLTIYYIKRGRMNKKTAIMLYIAAIIMYILVIGVASRISITSNDINSAEKLEENKIQVSQSVSVGVERHRWYGTIIETAGEGSAFANLYLFNLISLPLKKNNTGFMLYHLFFFLLATIILIVILMKGGTNGV